MPNISYKIEHEKIGLELFFNDGLGAAYHMRKGEPFTPENVHPDDFINVSSFNIGVTVHYAIFNQKYMKISPLLGLVKNWYDASLLGKWYSHEPKFYYQKESKLGLLIGVNLNALIWKGIYANTNARYSFFPTGQYNKQNLILELGFGYMYQRKVKKK